MSQMYGNIKHVGLHAFQLKLIKEDYYNPPIKKVQDMSCTNCGFWFLLSFEYHKLIIFDLLQR